MQQSATPDQNAAAQVDAARNTAMVRLSAKKWIKNIQIAVGVVIVLFFVICAIFANQLMPHDPVSTNMQHRFETPNATHWLGTDELGRDIMSRIMYGGRVSIMVGVTATTMGAILGMVIGIVAGYYGGKVDTLLGRLIDIMLAFPGLVLALAIVAILGPATTSTIFAITIFAIPTFARIVRGSTLNVKKLEYVDAIKALGANDFRVIFIHILPNIMTPIVVQATLYVATAIVISATLSFLGVGTQPPTPEWGTMLANGREFITHAPHITIIPGIAMFLLVMGINLIGDGIRDALEPKQTR